MCGGRALTLQRHEVGAQPAASGRAVVEVVEGEEVGGDGPGVSAVPGPALQLTGGDRLAQVHTSGTRHLQETGRTSAPVGNQ